MYAISPIVQRQEVGETVRTVRRIARIIFDISRGCIDQGRSGRAVIGLKQRVIADHNAAHDHYMSNVIAARHCAAPIFCNVGSTTTPFPEVPLPDLGCFKKKARPMNVGRAKPAVFCEVAANRESSMLRGSISLKWRLDTSHLLVSKGSIFRCVAETEKLRPVSLPNLNFR